MPAFFTSVRVGTPDRDESVAVFPLFTEAASGVSYQLSAAAVADGKVRVRELTKGGSVPTLLVENTGDCPVLFIEGEELCGAKQDRVLNTSVLVAAGSKTPIPVSCVEHGRWSDQSRHFGCGTSAPSTLRYILKDSVTRSIRDRGDYCSDQLGIWNEVARKQEVLGTPSATGDMKAVLRMRKDDYHSLSEEFPYVEGASGLCLALGDWIAAIDLFDKPATCRALWDRLMGGLALDAFEWGDRQGCVTEAQVAALLARLDALDWQPSPAVALGEERRARADEPEMAAVALVYEGVGLHVSANLAPPRGPAG